MLEGDVQNRIKNDCGCRITTLFSLVEVPLFNAQQKTVSRNSLMMFTVDFHFPIEMLFPCGIDVDAPRKHGPSSIETNRNRRFVLCLLVCVSLFMCVSVFINVLKRNVVEHLNN